jgi:hypothetical protein
MGLLNEMIVKKAKVHCPFWVQFNKENIVDGAYDTYSENDVIMVSGGNCGDYLYRASYNSYHTASDDPDRMGRCKYFVRNIDGKRKFICSYMVYNEKK